MDEDKLAKRLSEICAELKRTKDIMQQIRLLHEVNMILDSKDFFIHRDVLKQILKEVRKHDKKKT
jgi:hypothetical protein